MAAIAAPYQSIARRCKMPWSKLLFSSFSPSKSHRIELEENFISFLSLSLSLPRKFTRRKPADGRDRRIRGYFRWFGSIRSAVSHSKHESVELFLVFTFPPPSSASFHLRPSHIARAGRVGMFRFWNLRVIPTTLSLVRRPSSGQVSNYGVRRFDKANLTNFLFDQLSRGGILRRN